MLKFRDGRPHPRRLDNFEARFLINDVSLETGISWVYGGVVGSHGQAMAIVPGEPCLRCVISDVPEPGWTETCDTAGVIGPAVNVVASLQAVEAIKRLIAPEAAIEPTLTVVDVWEGTLRRLKLGADLSEKVDCPACRRGERRAWLRGERGAQPRPVRSQRGADLSAAGRRWCWRTWNAASPRADVRARNPFLLRLVPAGTEFELTLFPDGRAIIPLTEDISTARSLYARYVGS